MPATVVLLGLTSLLTDVSSEMVTAVLPLYLTFELSFSALQFGGFVGLAEAAQAAVRIGSGLVSDRRARHKRVAVTGYAISAVTRIAILTTGRAWVPTTGVLLADRVGKGIRTAPRDAMISLASPPHLLGRSFGVHRALDAAGALAGPIVAFGILAISSTAFDGVFVVSFAIALVGVAVIALFVPPPPATVAPVGGVRRAVVATVVRRPIARRMTAAAFVLGLASVGDAFVFLAYRRVADVDLQYFPLLFTGTAIVYLALAVPAGRLADRIGRRHVFVAGLGSLAIVYLSLLTSPPGVAGLLAVVGGLGAFYAATDGVLMAAASAVLDGATRTSGLAIVATGTAFGRAVAAVSFGALWTWRGPDVALTCFLVVVGAAMIMAWRLMGPVPQRSGATT